MQSQASSHFYFFSPATGYSAAGPCCEVCLGEGIAGKPSVGKGFAQAAFLLSLDFHSMVEVIALSLTSQIFVLLFGNTGL